MGPRQSAITWIGLHRFKKHELEALLDEAGFEPSIYHERASWMIAGGVRRSG
jgi:hypothetical protein